MRACVSIGTPLHTLHTLHTARIEDGDPGFEQDAWTASSESAHLLRADRWYYKGIDKARDDPDKSGLLLYIFHCSFTYGTYTIDVYIYVTYCLSTRHSDQYVDSISGAAFHQTQIMLSYQG